MANMTVRRVDVISAAKIQGIIAAALGLIIGIPYGLFCVAMGVLGQAVGGGIFVGIGVIVFAPIFYGILGFIGGAIGALVYNMAAGVIGGIKVELDETAA